MSNLGGSFDVSKLTNEINKLLKARIAEEQATKDSTSAGTGYYNSLKKQIEALKEEITKLNAMNASLNDQIKIQKQLTSSNTNSSSDSNSGAKNIENMIVAYQDANKEQSSFFDNVEGNLTNVTKKFEVVNGQLKQIMESRTIVDDGIKQVGTISESGTTLKTSENTTYALQQEKKLKQEIASITKFSADQELKLDQAQYVLSNKMNVSAKNANQDEYVMMQQLLLTKSGYISSLNQEIATQGKVTAEARDYQQLIVDINRDIALQQTKINVLERGSLSFWDKITTKAREYFNYAVAASALQQATQLVSNMVTEVIQLDAALVELQKVTDLEGESLDRFVEKAYEAGKAVAATGREMVEATTEFAKAGYDEDAALELGQLAKMYTNIADEEVGVAEASEFMIAQMKAFNIEASDSIKILDAVNEVANNYAVSSADIANNMGIASAVVSNAGNSMEQYIAMLTGITEITRDASKAANGLKSITLRLQGMNDEGETDLELMSEMQDMFTKLGLSVYDAEGNLKSTYDLLGALAPVYQDATTEQKAFITETIAGKHQAQNAAAALTNWNTVIDANATAMNSSGSAARENAIAMDSFEGKMAELKASFESLSNSLLDSGLLKMLVDIGTLGINILNTDIAKFVITVGVFTGAILLAGAALKIFAASAVWKAIIGFCSVASISFKGLAYAAGVATKSMLAFLATPAGAILAIVSAFTLLVTAVDSTAKKLDEAAIAQREFVEESSNKALDNYKVIEEQNDELDSQIAKYEELKNKLDEENLSLHDQISTRGEIYDIQKDIIDLYGDEASNIDLVNGNLEEQLALLREIKIGNAEAYLQENQGAIDVAQSALESDYYSYGGNGAKEGRFNVALTGFDDAKDTARLLADAFDQSMTYKYNETFGSFLVGFTDPLEEFQFQLKGTPEEVRDALVKVQEELNNNEGVYTMSLDEASLANLKKHVQTELDEINEYIEKNKAVLNAAAESIALTDEEYRGQYGQFLEAVDDYKIAVIEGDTEGISTATDQLATFQDFVHTLSDDPIMQNYFQNLLNGWQEQIEQNEIEDIIEKNNLKGDIETQIQIAGVDTDADILRGLAEDYTAGNLPEEFQNYNVLLNRINNTAGSAGKTLLEFIDILETMGVIAPGASKAMSDAALRIDDYQASLVSIMDELGSLEEVFNTLKDAQEEYNETGGLSLESLENLMSLSPEYLDLLVDENGQINLNALSLDNVANARINNAKALVLQTAYEEMAIVAENKESAELENLRTKYQLLSGDLTDTGDAYLDLAAKAAGYKAVEEMDEEDDLLIDSIVNHAKNQLAVLDNLWNGALSSTSSSSGSSTPWWETELERLKEMFDYNEITIEEYIDGIENVLGKLQEGSDEWREVKDLLNEVKLDDIEQDFDRGTISIEEYIDALKDLQDEYKELSQAWLDIADKIKDAYIDMSNEIKDSYDDAKDAIDGIIDEEIAKIEEKIEALEDVNDEQEREIELQRLKDNLENARNNKTKRVWNGSSWEWRADEEAIQEAEDALSDFEEETAKLDYEAQIEALEELKQQYEDITNAAEEAAKDKALADMLGAEAEQKILDDRIAALEEFKEKYNAIQAEIDKYENTPSDELSGANNDTDTQETGGTTSGSSAGSNSSYTVRAGDTLSGIASKYGISWRDLYEANKSVIGGNPNMIKPGQTYTIPGYANGGIVDYTGLAMLHGTPSKPEVVMNYDQIKTFMENITQPQVSPVNQNTNNETSYNFYGDFKLPNVNNAKQFLSELKSQVNVTKQSV